jgi:hypothetical protein
MSEGQATAQGLTRWGESDPVLSPKTYGSTKSYQVLKDDIRGWYRANAEVAPGSRREDFNPGFFEAGHPFSADCNVTEAAFPQLLKDVEANVTLMLEAAIRSVDVRNGTVHSLQHADGDTVTGTIFVDATDLGDRLPLCGVSWVYGPPGTPWLGVGTLPFQIPLGSLIPTDSTNLITACKNIGATHITSGAYRGHPGEWAIGEAAGALAAYCVGQSVLPTQVHANGARIAALQLRLLEQGVPIYWWDDLDYTKDRRRSQPQT